MPQRNVKPLSAQRLARRAELAAAIRSGDYERGTQCLEMRYPDGNITNCCLGVACRVAAKHRVKINERHDFPSEAPTLVEVYLTGSGGEQPNVARYYGFTRPEQMALANLNDNRYNVTGEFVTSWDEIAGHIETGDLR